MGSVPLWYRFVVGLKKWFASIFSWFASAVYWVESAHSCSVTFFECHYDTNDYWGTGCGYLKKIIFASFKNGNICDQTIQFIFWRTFFGSGLKLTVHRGEVDGFAEVNGHAEVLIHLRVDSFEPKTKFGQKWTVMKRQSLKPASDLSLGRAVSSWLIVPS